MGSRLVTLTGAPGVGKSRLGLELARKRAGGHPGGVWLVELASLGDGALVPAAVAAALRVGEVPGQSFVETIAAHIGGRRVLVVLDNCEHLLGACGELVDSLLGGCPGLSILATGREALGLEGERVWPVAPLEVPERGDAELPETLMRNAAVCLFAERATAVQPGFVLSSCVAPAVAEICRRLDGIPLAIELAAARVEILTPAEIAARLDDRFGLLTTRSRGVEPRHQTLLATLDWSHELLSSAERAMLRRVATFVGSFCLEAAETVCARGELETSEVLDLLAALVSKSLVVADTANSRGRYRLLETIRAYGSDRLDEAGEAAVLREAHACFYLALAEQAEPQLTGPHQERWLERLEGDRENLRLALEWSLRNGRAEWALRMAGALVLFWRIRCHFSEGRDLLEAVVAAGDGAPPALRTKVLWGAGFLTHMAGGSEAAIPIVEESLALASELGDVRGRARGLLILANARQYRGDPAVLSMLDESAALAREASDSWCLAHALALSAFEYAARNDLPAAKPLFNECLAVAREAEDKQGLRFGLLGLGAVAVRQGDYVSAEPLLEEALAVARQLGEDYVEATALNYIAELALGQGHHGRATELLDDVLALSSGPGPPGVVSDSLLLRAKVAHAEGDRRSARLGFEEVLARTGTPPALQGIAELAVDDGDLGEARRLFEQARELAQGIGDKASMAQALHGLGQLERAGGNVERAATLHSEALEQRRQIGDAPGIAASLEALGGLAAAAGRHEHAARLFAVAKVLRDRNGYARAPRESARYEADVGALRRALSAEELNAASAQGSALSIEQAVAQASKRHGRRRPPASGWASLTAMEQQVAALVAEGLTNRQIARRLFVTAGTVKNHLSHIYLKLGMARRSELAREVERRRHS